MWQQDHEPDGIKITIADEPDVLSYIRYGKQKDDFYGSGHESGASSKDHFRVPVPSPGTYEIILNTEDAAFGGTWTKWQQTLTAEIGENHDVPAWLDVILPAMGALVIKPKQLKPLPKNRWHLKASSQPRHYRDMKHRCHSPVINGNRLVIKKTGAHRQRGRNHVTLAKLTISNRRS